ncbi:response regulator [Planomonospora corallina]|uniref:histidine kinase n=1 Tax=Planomonospora corallina TaxID=1806052 RepID=A0ABV8I452_9ACTN
MTADELRGHWPVKRFLRLPLILVLAALGTLPVVRAVQSSSDHLLPVAVASLVLTVLALVHIVATGRRILRCPQSRRSLRNYVLGLTAGAVVLGVLPIAGLAYLAVQENTGGARADVERRLTTSADVSADYIGNQVDAARELVTSYAQRPSVRRALASGGGDVDRHLAELRAHDPSLFAAWAMDKSGRVLAISPSHPEVVGEDFSGRDYFQGVLRTGKPYVSEAFSTVIVEGRRVVAVAAPVTDGEGRITGLVAAGYPVEALTAFTDRLSGMQGVRLTLADQKGTLLSGGDDRSGPLTGTRDEHVWAALAGGSGTGRSLEDGYSHEVAYRPVPELGWAVVAEIPTSVAFAPADAFTGRVTAAALALTQLLMGGLVMISCAERRRQFAEEDLIHREEQVGAIIEAAGEAFIAVDRHSRIIRWNSQAEATFGWSAEEAMGRNPVELIIPEEQRAFHAANLQRALSRGALPTSGSYLEIEALRHDGTVFPAEMTVWSSSTADGTTFNTFIRDVTARKRADAELAAARDEALAASRMKSEFVANMSHEIRTPLNGVIGMTTLLLDTELDARQRGYLTTVQNSADALLTVINDILDFSKIEAGKLDIDPVDFDVRVLVEDVVSLMAATAQAKGLEIAAVVNPAIPPALHGDVHRIRQVLTNLVSNAVKFTERGEVVVEVAVGPAEGDSGLRQVLFSVTDTGIGIPADRQESLFDAFTQADASTTRRYGGTGLGLTISRQLVELMTGTMGVTSTVGVGSRFHFTLPLPGAAAPPAAPPCQSTDLAGVRVLVVDDNRTNRTVVRDLLTGWGMRALTAPDGLSALDLLRESAAVGDPFTLALLDMHMPDLDGLQLARAVVADPALSGTRLAMLTSTNHAGEAQTARECGIEVYLTKPVRASQLRDGLLRLLGRASADTARTAGTAVPPAAPAPVPSAPGGRDTDGVRILVAEDNEVNQQVVVEMLAGLGYAADVAGDGEEALRLLRTDRYDLVLMDCQMPRLDGYQATEQIRRMPGPVSAIPVVALTASALASDEQRCRAAGMDAFLPKPLRKQQLDATLRTALAGRAGDAGEGRAAPAAAADRTGGGGQESPEPVAAGTGADAEGLLDPDVLDELRDIGPKLTEKFLPSYLHNASTATIAIMAAAERRDLEELARLAHKLRGSSAAFAGRRLSETCTALERVANAGDADSAAALATAVAHQADATSRALVATLVRES